ncbi:hypothetical protein MNJPNG_06225 [Cupriavidus oxalaticus]
MLGPVPHLIETIGDAVSIAGMPPESCAVHPSPEGVGFTVSHIGSGYKIASAATIDSAIEAAQARVKLAALHPKKMLAGLRAATQLKRAVEAGAANGAAP